MATAITTTPNLEAPTCSRLTETIDEADRHRRLLTRLDALITQAQEKQTLSEESNRPAPI